MASHNSILRHVHMATVKRNTLKLQEQKLEEERRIKEALYKVRYKSSPLYSDWRFDLSENMTTQAMTYATTLPGEGDTVLGDASGWVDSSDSEDVGGVSVSDNIVVITPNDIPIGSTGPNYQQSIANTAPFDARDMTSAKVTLIRTRAGVEDSNVRLFANYGSDPNQFYINAYFGDTGSASRLINIANYQNLDKLRFQIRASNNKKWSIDDPNDPNYGSGEYVTVDTSDYTLKIEYQRRTPITVFVPLDSPESTSFVRTGEFSELSNEEKIKKLKEMMSASDQYLFDKFGDAFPGTNANQEFTDVSTAPSWEQAGGYGLRPDGTSGQSKLGDVVPDSLGNPYKLIPRILKDGTPAGPGQNIWSPVRKADAGSGDTEIAVAGVPRNTGGSSSGDPNNIQWPRDKYPDKKAPPGPGARLRLAHHEPEGEMIIEKKLKNPQTFFKDKDIKPEFPENPPPPQIKGLHPDLVTGEKTAQRFNKLDPISAKAMPRTGIKAIDKKVDISKKKPK